MDDEKGNPTVVPAEDFDSETDSKVLRKAMKGFGTDEDAIINVVAYRSSEQLKEVQKKFKVMHGRDLIKDLESELKGNLEKAVIGRFYTPREFDAWCLRKAMKGMGTDESCLADVICTKTNKEINAIKAAFKELFDRDLEKDVASETSGDFGKMLVSILQGARDEKEPDEDLAKEDAKRLHEAGADKWGTDEGMFNQIFCLRSHPQLALTCAAYKKAYGKDMLKVVDSEMSGNLQKAYEALLGVTLLGRPFYYSTVLRKSMKGMGTDDETLIRTINARCEIDLEDIKTIFKKEHAKDLDKNVKKETSGDYRKMLMAVLKSQ